MAAPKKTKEILPDLPSLEEALAVYTPLENLKNFQARIGLLATKPPQVILLEGGRPHERVAIAYYWAALHNCETSQSTPCLQCSTCTRIGANMHSDVIVFDGRADTFKIDNMRALKPIIGENPHFANKRIILFLEAQTLRAESANSLLKMLEEPNQHTLFLFTVPQRARLLPTIISRSFALTLPWPRPQGTLDPSGLSAFTGTSDFSDPIMQSWNQGLATFLQNGTGWFSKTSSKTDVNRDVALQVILSVQKALANKMAQRSQTPLDVQMQKLPLTAIPQVNELLEQAQDFLNYDTNPALVLDSLATELFLYFK